MHLELISMEFWVRLQFYFFFYVDILSLQCSSPVIYSDASIDTPQPSAPALIKARSQWLTLSLSSEMALTLPYFPGVFWILLAFFLL